MPSRRHEAARNRTCTAEELPKLTDAEGWDLVSSHVVGGAMVFVLEQPRENSAYAAVVPQHCPTDVVEAIVPLRTRRRVKSIATLPSAIESVSSFHDLPKAEIKPGETVQLEATVHFLFRGSTLVIEREVNNSNLVIQKLAVKRVRGEESFLRKPAPRAQPKIDLKPITVMIGETIVMEVVNKGSEIVHFESTMRGLAVG